MVTPTTALRPSNRVSPVLALKEARRNHHNHWPKAPRWAMALARLHLRSGLQGAVRLNSVVEGRREAFLPQLAMDSDLVSPAKGPGLGGP